MQTEFQSGGVRYSLQVTPTSRRELDARAENLKPDQALWTNEQRRKHGLTHKEPHLKMGYLDDEAELRKRADRHGRERQAHFIKPPSPEDFTDRAEYR